MITDYYKIPFGGQLLIWSSRVALYGFCSAKPNKYDIINTAYSKVGIKNGSLLLKPFIRILKNKKNFKVQPLCKRYLNETEIKLINCIEYNKFYSNKNDYFIREWKLDDEKDKFEFYAKKIASNFKIANLNTNIQKSKKHFERIEIKKENLRTLH